MNFEKYRQVCESRLNLGIIESPDAVGRFKNEGCGDDYVYYMRINPDKRLVEDVKFTTTGCGFGFAALALMAECCKGRTLEECRQLSEEDIEAGIEGFPPKRRHYLTEALETLQSALDQYESGDEQVVENAIPQNKLPNPPSDTAQA